MSGVQIHRPERWGIPFSEEMTAEDVENLLELPLFAEGLIDPDQFSARLPLAGILQNDARLWRCTGGEILIRQGEWGNSAFFLLSGAVRVVVERGKDTIPPDLFGQTPVQQQSFLDLLKQFFNRSREPEQRDLSQLTKQKRNPEGNASPSSHVYLQDFSRVIDTYNTNRIEAVDFFGEQSALGRIERSASVFADGECELLEVRWQGIRDMMKKAPWLRKQIDMRFRAYGLYSFLRNSPYFAHLAIPEDAPQEEAARINDIFQQVLNEAVLCSYGSYDKVDRFINLVEKGNASDLVHEPLIAKEGDYVEGVYLVRSGIARVSHRYNNGHRTISYLTPGQVFGVSEVVEAWRDEKPIHLQHSLRAVGYVTVIFIPTIVFEHVVLNQIMPKREPATSTDLPELIKTSETVAVDVDLLEFLVERRFVNGSATMVIDLDRCTRCDDCVRACATAHDNNPRFLRHGPIHDKYMVANACMHCADPVCMIQCPTGAIHRNLLHGEVVVNDEACIGCGACANNCPYDAIRMVQIRDLNGEFIYPTQKTTTQPDGTTQIENVTPADQEWEPLVKATKCDLCADQITGPACQQACPHDALVRLNLGTFETAAEWFNR